MAVELAAAYVSIVPSARGFKEKLAKELDIEQPAEQAGRAAGGRISGALGKALKAGAIGAGVAAGAALSTALVKGWGRLTAIEDAQSKLQGLGHSADGVSAIMDNALASVKGTAFGLDEAASVAASTVAAGIRPGEQLERVLSLVGDTATIAGSSMGEMGSIFNKVAASNRLTMGEVNQLADRGVPIMQMLADEYGVTAAEASKMVSSGQVDFEAFSQAIEANVAGAALESGDTTRGAFANMMAAGSRFGAAMLEGLFPVAKEVFGGMIGLIDRATEAAKPWAETFSEFVLTRVVPAAQTLMGNVGEMAGRVQEFLQSAEFEGIKTETLDRLGSIFETLAGAARDLGPAVATIAGSIGQATAAIGISTWEILLATVDAVARVAAAVLVPAIQALAGWMERNQTAVTTLVGAYVAYRTATVAVRTVTAVTMGVIGAYRAVTLGIAAASYGAAGATYAQGAALKVYNVISRATVIATKAWTAVQWLFNAAMSANPIGLVVIAIVALVAAIVIAYKKSETFRNIVDAAFRAVGDAAEWLWENAIKPAWEGIKSAFEMVAAVITWWWKNVVTRAFEAVVAVGKWLWDMIKKYFGFWKGMFDRVRGWVTGAKDWVVQKFTDVVDFVKKLPGKIRSAASGMWDGIKSAFRSAVNWIIDKWNSLSFTLGPISMGPLGQLGPWTLSTPNIPRLAQGGIVPPRPGGRIVQVAEAGQAEAVIPLDRLERMVGGGAVVVVDGTGLDRALEQWLRGAVRARGGGSVQRFAGARA